MAASQNCKKHSSNGIDPSRKCLEFMIQLVETREILNRIPIASKVY